MMDCQDFYLAHLSIVQRLATLAYTYHHEDYVYPKKIWFIMGQSLTVYCASNIS